MTREDLQMTAPKNLRIEMEPYPHLRDDEGCILARDYIHQEKMAFILNAVAAVPSPPAQE